MITPTVGRVVLFNHNNKLEPGWIAHGPKFAAIVTHVWSDRCINIAGFDSNGQAFGLTSVDLLQDDDEPAGRFRWCEWMPYQKGQAAKTEQVESDLQAARRMASAGEPLIQTPNDSITTAK